jgi:hypothetical protein
MQANEEHGGDPEAAGEDNISPEERERLGREERERERLALEAEAERLAIEKRKLARERREKVKNEKMRKEVVRMNKDSARRVSNVSAVCPSFNDIQQRLTVTKHDQRVRIAAHAKFLSARHAAPRKRLHERLVTPTEETSDVKHKGYHDHVCSIVRKQAPEMEGKLWEQYVMFARSSDAAEEWAARNFFDFLMSIGRPFVSKVLFDFVYLLPAAAVSKRRAFIKIATPEFTELIEERLPQWKADEWKPLFNPTTKTYKEVRTEAQRVLFLCCC